ncbi:MAG: ribonuclease J [Alphaproteobacteria bacterium]|nr:MAG: ribonuclease J [Alphaproteobacteria bacterium]
MSTHQTVIDAARDGLVYLPIGGAGEIGMNMYAYGCQGKWIVVECGVTFGDETTPGIDVITADPAFLEDLGDDLLAMVLTHAHEDHQGAVAYLWPRLRCPVYATAFTAAMVRTRLAEAGLIDAVPLKELPVQGAIELGPFRLRFITVTHSIPEPNALAIDTPHGRILHTGDWKLDPDPLIGATADEKALRELGDGGVLAMVCDSTNVFVDGDSGSESDVREALCEVVGRFRHRVAVACFASNVVRIESIAKAAAAHGRQVALVGRSLWRVTEIARDCGYLAHTPPFLTEHDVGFLPRDKVLFICTGSQGERGAALARISQNDHANVVLEEGDALLFSSRDIPGNERAIYAMQDRFAALGVEIVTGRDAPIHVSGHPARDELARLYDWVRPSISVPMHGTHRHLIEHAAFARALGVADARIVTNGAALRLAPGQPKIVGQVTVGRLGLDGKRLVALDDGLMTQRRRMNYSGLAFVSLALGVHGDGGLPAPRVTLRGLASEQEAAGLVAEIEAEVARITARAAKRKRGTEETAEEVRRAVRRVCGRLIGKKPVTEVHVFRL